MKSLFSIGCFLLFYGVQCNKDDCHRVITITNSSNQNVTVAFSIKDVYNKCILTGSVIKPGENYIHETRGCWDTRVHDNNPYDVYIIDPLSFNASYVFYNCDSIEVKNKVLKHYVLTIDELRRNDFTITYQ